MSEVVSVLDVDAVERVSKLIGIYKLFEQKKVQKKVPNVDTLKA